MMSTPLPALQAVRKGLSLVAMALCGLFVVGCSCDPGRYNVNVSLEGFTNKPAIEVHIVGVNKADDPKWRNLSMGTYWKAQERFRETGDKVVMRFGGNSPVSQTFNTTSPEWESTWKRWESKHVTKLYVIAFIPGDFVDQPGDSDQRRAILPLGTCHWEKLQNKELKVVLTPSGVKVVTPPEKLDKEED
jgi:hypothetical protein